MQLLAQRAPEVHIPHVYNTYKIGNVGYIVMDYIPGQTLGKCWATLSDEDRESIRSQLAFPILHHNMNSGTMS